MKTEHTHRGTCQACGARQAVDNDSKLVAKHGYRVAGFGFFNGVCQGADHVAAEIEVDLTHRIILACQDWERRETKKAAALTARTVVLTEYTESHWDRRVSKHITTTHPITADTTKYIVDRTYDRAIGDAESQARNARSHWEALTRCVLPRLGQPLYAVARKPAPRVFTAGEVVKFDGREVKLLEPRYGFRGGAVKWWKFAFLGESATRMASIATLRKYNAPQNS
jgi:hypothetical protein